MMCDITDMVILCSEIYNSTTVAKIWHTSLSPISPASPSLNCMKQLFQVHLNLKMKKKIYIYILLYLQSEFIRNVDEVWNWVVLSYIYISII